MKDLIFKLRYFLISFAILSLAMGGEQSFLKKNTEEINISHFAKIFYNKQNQLKNLSNNIVKKINSFDKDEKNIWDKIENENNLKNLNESGFYFFIYKNDSLKYWSANHIPIPIFFSDFQPNTEIIKLQNAWYHIDIASAQNIKTISMFLIKTQFPYENKFLKNSFHKDFDIENSVAISLFEDTQAIPFYDKNNNYLFSLHPSKKLGSSVLKPYLIIIIYLIALFLLFFSINKFFFHWKAKNSSLLILKFLALGMILFFTRFFMIYFKFPMIFDFIELFEPQYFGLYVGFNSIGDFILNLIFFMIFFYQFLKDTKKRFQIFLKKKTNFSNFLSLQ